MQYFGCNARGLEVFLFLENLGSSSCVIIDHYQKSYQQLRLEDETHARAAGFLGTVNGRLHGAASLGLR